MFIEAMQRTSIARTWSRTAHAVLFVGCALAVGSPSAAFAQEQTYCGPEIKEEVVKTLAAAEGSSEAAQLRLEAELYAKYKYCAQDAQFAPPTFVAAARECGAGVSNLGSVFYEEMSCCGYDPQRRQFACPVKVKQPFGFGGTPLPGSREHVLHCVANASGALVPVGRDSVHLANEIGVQSPTWQFAVIANANQNLQTVYPMNGQTRRARSILSWALTPTNCNYTPIWGNALNYRIRLDQ